MQNDSVAEVAELLRQAGRILCVTGAGISADSGLPTYRGVGGLYNQDVTEDGIAIETALSGPMFARRPELTWKYLWQIGSACVGAVPNAAHQLIADLHCGSRDVWVITQNVDGLHRAAGSRQLVEVHGHAFDLFCTVCRQPFTADELIGGYSDQPDLPPKCPDCGGVVRPNVVLFEESLPLEVQNALYDLSMSDFDVVLAVGTSAMFPYIAGFVTSAHYRGIPTVEINPSTTAISHLATCRIQLSAAAAAERIRERLDGG